MSNQSTFTSPARQLKRERLREIVERLGENATPPQIRQEAYRVGFGPVNASMMLHVRNGLWPNRKKLTEGCKPGVIPTKLFTPAFIAGLPKCPKCDSQVSRVLKGYRRKDGTMSRRRVCTVCQHQFFTVHQNQDRLSNKLVSHLRAELATEKECATCGMVLAVEHFGKIKVGSPCYRSSCKACLNLKRHYKGIQETLSRYQISLADYEALLVSQDHKCAICGSADMGVSRNRGVSRRLFALDHCHKTGKIRGLLCNKCNLGIGNFNDDIQRLEAAVAYLRRYAEVATDGREGR